MDAGQGWEDGLEQPGGLGGVVLLLEGLVQPHGESAGPGQHSSKEWLLLLEVPGLLSGQGEHCRQGLLVREVLKQVPTAHETAAAELKCS